MVKILFAFLKGGWLHFSLHHVSCLCGAGHHLHPGYPRECRHKIFGRGGRQRGEEEDQWQSLCSTLEVGLKKTFRFRTIKSEVQPQCWVKSSFQGSSTAQINYSWKASNTSAGKIQSTQKCNICPLIVCSPQLIAQLQCLIF